MMKLEVILTTGKKIITRCKEVHLDEKELSYQGFFKEGNIERDLVQEIHIK